MDRVILMYSGKNAPTAVPKHIPRLIPHRLIAVFLFLLLFLTIRPTKNTAKAIPTTTSGSAAIIKSCMD